MYDILGLLLLMTDVAQHNYFAKREAFEARRISNYWRYRGLTSGATSGECRHRPTLPVASCQIRDSRRLENAPKIASQRATPPALHSSAGSRSRVSERVQADG